MVPLARRGGKRPQALLSLPIPISPCLTSSKRVSFIDILTFLANIPAEYPNFQINPNLPVINVGNQENPNYLPAEVCVIEPGQTIKRRLSPSQTQAMITFACRKPWENGDSIVGDGKAVLKLNAAAKGPLVSFLL